MDQSSSQIAFLKKQAKRLLKAHRSGEVDACERFKRQHPRFRDTLLDGVRQAHVVLREAQHVIAREQGFASWTKMIAFMQKRADRTSLDAAIAQLKKVHPRLAAAFGKDDQVVDTKLTREQEYALILRVKEGDEDARKELKQAYFVLAASLAKQYMHQGVALTRLLDTAEAGLIAAALYCPRTKISSFQTYARWWIVQVLIFSVIRSWPTFGYWKGRERG